MNDTKSYNLIKTDALIIGAGPVGLFAVFELGLLGIKSHVIDVLDKVGGQCSVLYPEKPIYDIPGLPFITAQGLVDNLMEQIKPFNPSFLLNQIVENITTKDNEDEDYPCITKTNQGITIESKIVIIATGSGLFSPKELTLENQEQFKNQSLFYSMPGVEKLPGKDIVITGGGDSALDWIIELSQHDDLKSLSLVHRRYEFKAVPASVQKVKDLIESNKVNFYKGVVCSLEGEGGNLKKISVMQEDNNKVDISLDYLCVFYGMNINSESLNVPIKLHDDGRILVNTEDFETSSKRIFSIGDINFYPGKLKLILCGFHESALVAKRAYEYIFKDKKFRLEYTTASSTLKKRLGVQ